MMERRVLEAVIYEREPPIARIILNRVEKANTKDAVLVGEVDGCLHEADRDKDIKVVILSASNSPADINAALARGANGFILKSVNPIDLPSALRQVHEGTVFHAGMGAPGATASPAEEAGLTDRELTLLRALARGLSNKQISKELWISEQTVKFHVSNIYRKLDVSNRAGAVRWAHEQGIAGEVEET